MVNKGHYLKSPFRNQLRPANGVFHAVFVLARIVFRLSPMAQAQANNYAFNIRLRHCAELLDESLKQFNDPQILTPAGALLLHEIASIIATQKNGNHVHI